MATKRLHWGRAFASLVFLFILIGCGGTDDNKVGVGNSSSSSASSSSSSSTSSSGVVPVNVCLGTENLGLGLSGAASSVDADSSDTNLMNAFDGNESSRWSSEYSDDEWLAVDFGEIAWVCSVELIWEAAYGQGYQIQVSDDGVSWVTVATETNGDGGVDYLELDHAVQARHVRMLGTERGTEWGYSLWEMNIQGAFAGPPLARFVQASTAVAGNETTLDASQSHDPGGYIAEYFWDFGDGVGLSSAEPVVSHVYQSAGDFDVNLIVTDNDGLQSSYSLQLRVQQNVAAGRSIWNNQCVDCHAEGDEFIRKDLQSLTQYISAAMPLGNANQCVGACASDVAAFILSWQPNVSLDCDGSGAPPSRALRLLTNEEYQNTIDDIFNNSSFSDIAEGFPGSIRVGGFDNNVDAETVGESRMGVYWEAAKKISSVAAQQNIQKFVSCSNRDQACGTQLVESLGLHLFRRPVTGDELASYRDLFMAGANFTDAAAKVIRGMLISPNFLYRSELGVSKNEFYQLTPYETATLLAYTFTGSTPDNILIAAAQNNQLATRDQLITQVQRLLADDNSKNAFAHFARQWLHTASFRDISKDTATFPEFTNGIRDAMTIELDKFVTSIFLGDSTQYKDLYVSDYTFANQELANYYGLPGGTASFDRVQTDETRGGILKLGAVLASLAKPNDTSPVLRGVFVRKSLLCQNMPLPDATLEINIPQVDPTLSTRERFAAHSDSPVCAGCHQYIDPLGFGFDTYDGVGKLNEFPDDSGVITGLSELSGSDSHGFKGVPELSEILATSHGGAACVVKQFQIYATGRQEQEACTVYGVAERWKNENYRFLDLWSEIVTADNFLIRQ